MLRLAVAGHVAANAVFSLLLLSVAAVNYPGGKAIARLQRLELPDSHVSVHICNLAAQTGVSRFTQIYDGWRYDKTEHLTIGSTEMMNFTHLLVEAKSKYSPSIKPLMQTHQVLASIDGFSHIAINYGLFPPIRIKTKPQLFILKQTIGDQTKTSQDFFSEAEEEMEVEVEEDLSTESTVLEEVDSPESEHLKNIDPLQDTEIKSEVKDVLDSSEIDHELPSVSEESNQEIESSETESTGDDYSSFSTETSDIYNEAITGPFDPVNDISDENDNSNTESDVEEPFAAEDFIQGLENETTQDYYKPLSLREEVSGTLNNEIDINQPNNETFPKRKSSKVKLKNKTKVNVVDKADLSGKIKNVKDNIKNIIKKFNEEEDTNDANKISDNEQSSKTPKIKNEINYEEDDRKNTKQESGEIRKDALKDLNNGISDFETLQSYSSNKMEDAEVNKEGTLGIKQKSTKSFSKVNLRSKIREVKSRLEKEDPIQKTSQVEDPDISFVGGQKNKNTEKDTRLDYAEEEVENDEFESGEVEREHLDSEENGMLNMKEESSKKEMIGSDVKRSIEVKIPSKGIKVKITDGNVIEILETNSNENTDDVKVKITGGEKDPLSHRENVIMTSAFTKKTDNEPSNSENLKFVKGSPTQTKKKQKIKQYS